MPRVIFATLFCFGALSATLWADDQAPVSDTVVRDAVSRSLPFLEKEGVAWMNTRLCMSCHHVPFLLWSHRLAQAQGFTVESQKLAEWDEWTRKDSLSNRRQFWLRNYDLGKPEAATLPQAVKDKLKPLIARPFQTEAEYLAELTPLLTDDEMKLHRATVLTISERTLDMSDRVGGGLEGAKPLADRKSRDCEYSGSSGLSRRCDRPDEPDSVGGRLVDAGRSGNWDALDTSDGRHQATAMWTTLALASYGHTGSEAICVA